MNTAQLGFIGIPVLLLAFANGANDVSRGVATLIGSGLATARQAILWGTLCTVLGGFAAILWGAALVANFVGGYLATSFHPDAVFVAGAMGGAFGWVALATFFGLPVSTTHSVLGGIVGAALTAAGPSGLKAAAIANKALLPLLASPLIAIVVCWILLLVARWVSARVPAWRPGCCDQEDWRVDPFVCADNAALQNPWRTRLLHGMQWLSSGATSFARGLNDVPKIAAFLILALPEAQAYAQDEATWLAIGLVALVMGAGSLWGGARVARVLAHRVTKMDSVRGLTANLGTSCLVLAASPLGLPVSTTHVSTGALMGVRLAEKAAPVEADALKAILSAWIVTLPAAGVIAAGTTALMQLAR